MGGVETSGARELPAVSHHGDDATAAASLSRPERCERAPGIYSSSRRGDFPGYFPRLGV